MHRFIVRISHKGRKKKKEEEDYRDIICTEMEHDLQTHFSTIYVYLQIEDFRILLLILMTIIQILLTVTNSLSNFKTNFNAKFL